MMIVMMSVVHWRFPDEMRNLSNNQLILLTCIKTSDLEHKNAMACNHVGTNNKK